MAQHVLIHGPKACGKTLRKDALAKAFECSRIIDLESTTPGGREVLDTIGKDRTLILTSDSGLRIADAIHFEFVAAMAVKGIKDVRGDRT